MMKPSRPAPYLTLGLLAIALSLTACSSREYNEYMETHDPAPQQKANQNIQEHQQRSALRAARLKAKT